MRTVPPRPLGVPVHVSGLGWTWPRRENMSPIFGGCVAIDPVVRLKTLGEKVG